MSRMMPSGGRRSCTRSIQAPDRSVSAARLASRRQPLGLEAAHLAGRGRRSVDTLPADDGAHRRIAGEPLGIVDVFVAGEPAVDRLAWVCGRWAYLGPFGEGGLLMLLGLLVPEGAFWRQNMWAHELIQ